MVLEVAQPGTTQFTWVLSTQTGLPASASRGWSGSGSLFLGCFLGAMTLGLASLISNNFLSADAQVRRKAHVMLWGTVIGVTPISLIAGAAFIANGFANIPLVLWEASVLLLLSVWPLSFAYAVVKHRVLEIPVLLKRSAPATSWFSEDTSSSCLSSRRRPLHSSRTRLHDSFQKVPT